MRHWKLNWVQPVPARIQIQDSIFFLDIKSRKLCLSLKYRERNKKIYAVAIFSHQQLQFCFKLWAMFPNGGPKCETLHQRIENQEMKKTVAWIRAEPNKEDTSSSMHWSFYQSIATLPWRTSLTERMTRFAISALFNAIVPQARLVDWTRWLFALYVCEAWMTPKPLFGHEKRRAFYSQWLHVC